MIQSWNKQKDASGNIIYDASGNPLWKGRVVASTSTDNIIVTSPSLLSAPASLTSTLGYMNKRINELYGNIKWIVKNGVGGKGGSGGGGGSDTGVPTLSILDANKTKVISGSSISVSSSTYQINLFLQNAEQGVSYAVTVFNNITNQVYASNVQLNKSTTMASVNITGITGTTNITAQMRSSAGESFLPVTTTLRFATVEIDAEVYQNGNFNPIGNGTKTVDADGYNMRITLKPSTPSTVHYKIETNMFNNGTALSFEDTVSGLSSSNPLVLQAPTLPDFSEFMVIGNSYTIKVTAEMMIDGVVMATSMQTYQPRLISTDSLYIIYRDEKWVASSNDYSTDAYFSDGNNLSLNTYLTASQSLFPTVFYIIYFYGCTGIDGNGNETWELIDQPGEEDPINYGTLDGFPFAGDEDYAAKLQAWQDTNTSLGRKISMNRSGSTQSDINIPYSKLSEKIRFAYDKANSSETFSQKFARIRADFYVFSFDGDEAHNLIPQTPDQLVPMLQLKTEILQSAVSIPNYVTGIETVIGEGTDQIINQTKDMYFNLDTLSGYVSALQNYRALNVKGGQYINTTNVGLGGRNFSMPMDLFQANGNTSGFLRSNLTSANGTQYLAFRTAGGSYGHIKKESFAKFFGGSTIDWQQMTNGFAIELVFQADWHPNNEGTIFSMADYSSDGNMSLGINVDLEKIEFKIQHVDPEHEDAVYTASISKQMTQNALTQLDFVCKIVPKNGSTPQTAIIMLYQNGICSGLDSIEMPYTTASSTSRIALGFSSLQNGIILGCKTYEKNGEIVYDNHADVNFYGLRIYHSWLSNNEINKNWLITSSLLNRTLVDDVYVNDADYISRILRKNFMTEKWVSKIWDFETHEVANANKLFEQFKELQEVEETVKNQDGTTTTRTVSKRELPILLLTQTNTKNYELFYQIYREGQVELTQNNKRFDDENIANAFNGDSAFLGTMQYFDTTGTDPVTSPSGLVVGWDPQGTSTQANRSKNIELCAGYVDNGQISVTEGGSGDLAAQNNNKVLFTPNPQKYLPENRWTLKADVMDSAHANNAAIGTWINESGFMPANPAQTDPTNKYRSKVKTTLEGFPVLVFVDWNVPVKDETSGSTTYISKRTFLGIYSFNLGRGSHFNLGFRQFEGYELMGVSSGSDNDPDSWTDPDTVTTAAFVNRYRAKEAEGNVWSFECNINDPAASFAQPNRQLIQNTWDLRYYASNKTTPEVGYSRLKDIISAIAYHNVDDKPTYYYGIVDDNVSIMPAYRESEDDSTFFLASDVEKNADGTYTLTQTYRAVNNIPSGQYTHLIETRMKWEEGLERIEGALSLDGQDWTDTTSQHRVYLDNEGVNWYSTPSRTNSDEWDVWLHYLSFARYWVVTMMFGMVDSLGKNFTLRSWNLENGHGTIFPAFYDMDTALGLDNEGRELIDPTSYPDFWVNLEDQDGNTSLRVFQEQYPWVDEEHIITDSQGKQYYNWYDKEGGELIGAFEIGSIPLPKNAQYDLRESHLWHVIRFMPTFMSLTTGQNISRGQLSPVGQWGQLRASLKDYNSFIDDYFLAHNENVGEIVFNLDYQEKYMTPYATKTGEAPSYPDMKFCNGRRTDFIRNWLRNRVAFLDSVLNLGCMYSLTSTPTTKEVAQFGKEYAWYTSPEVFNQTLVNNAFGLNETNAYGESISPYKEIISLRSNGTSSARFEQTLESNIATALVINLTTTKYRFFLRPNVKTKVSYKAIDSNVEFTSNSISAMSYWDGIKQFNLRSLDSKGDWNLLELDLSGTTSLAISTNDDFNLSGYTELRKLNLNATKRSTTMGTFNLSIPTLTKLQWLDIRDSDVNTLSLPNGGNIETLYVARTQISELSLINLSNLKGILDLSGCTALQKLTITNCPQLEGITFAQNKSLTSIQITDCPGMTSFSYDGRGNTQIDGDQTVYTSTLSVLSIKGDCSGMRSVSISNLANTGIILDLSGARDLSDLTLANIQTSNVPILPKYDVADLYPIYKDDHSMRISLTGVSFPCFALGNGEGAFVTHDVEYAHAEGDVVAYPVITTHRYNEKATGYSNLIMNLAVFGKIDSFDMNNCSGVENIAFKYSDDNIIKNLSISRLPNLKRIFGKIEVDAGTFYKNITSFRLCEWNDVPTDQNMSSLAVKEAYEAAVRSRYSDETVNAFISLMHDDAGLADDQLVQGIRPITRLVMKEGATSIENVFRNTGISANDLYYILLVMNQYNASATKKITVAKNAFSTCQKIYTSFDAEKDLSLSRFAFRDLWSLETIAEMFTGDANMTGVLYSPDINSFNAGATTAEQFADMIGTLTPLAINCKDFSNLGWSISMYDDYAYWTPASLPTYWDPATYWQDGFIGLEVAADMMNNVMCINSAVAGSVNAGETYFSMANLVKYFKNVVKFGNSFNGLHLSVKAGGSTAPVQTSDRLASYCPLLRSNTKLEEIQNSFNDILPVGSVIIDLFGGQPSVMSEMPSAFSSRIQTIKSSFRFTTTGGNSFFVFTDDMFQRIASTLKCLDPVGESNGEIDPDTIVSMFGGTNIIKTYAKYPSDVITHSDKAMFPYGALKNCSKLEIARGLFAGMDLRYYVDMRGNQNVLTSTILNAALTDTQSLKYADSSSFSVSLPDFYESKPYAPVIGIDGTVSHAPSIKMLSDTTSLSDFSHAFRGIITPFFNNVSGGNTYKIPVGWELTSESFASDSSLTSLAYAFASNHYMKGHIPYRFLYTGDIVETKTLSPGWTASSAAELSYGFIGLSRSNAKIGASYLSISSISSVYAAKNAVDQGLVTPGTTTSGLQQFNSSGVYVPDNGAIESEAFVIKIADASLSTPEVTSGNMAVFEAYDRTKHLGMQKYRRIVPSWWQKFDHIDETLPSYTLNGSTVQVTTNRRNITDIDHLFYKNDAAGFLYLRYNENYNIAPGIVASSQNEAAKYANSEKFKLNAYVKDSYMKVGTSYANRNVLVPDPLYSTAVFLPNPDKDTRLTIETGYYIDQSNFDKAYRYAYETGVEKYVTGQLNFDITSNDSLNYVKRTYGLDGVYSDSEITSMLTEAYEAGFNNGGDRTKKQLNGVPVMMPNPWYDPREVIFNSHRTKLTYNKYLHDGIKFEEPISLIADTKDVLAGTDFVEGVDYQASSQEDDRALYATLAIPSEWSNPTQKVFSYVTHNEVDQESQMPIGIFVERDSTGDTTYGSKSLTNNEIDFIAGIKADQHFFCPSDMFQYVANAGSTKLTYVFANGGYQTAKRNVTTYKSEINRDASSMFSSEENAKESFYLKSDPVAASLISVNDEFIYYTEGNMYTGFPGRVSPIMFEGLSNITSIEGMFWKNPQISPYTYPGEVSGSYVQGELWEPSTFNGLSSLANTYLLWSNNSVPRGVHIDSSVFSKNVELQYIDYIFAGTLWYGYKSDDQAYGPQVQKGLFDAQTKMLYANSAFLSPVNFNFAPSNDALSIVNAVDINPAFKGKGENGNIGAYSVRSVPSDLFDKSRSTLLQANNLFYFDQNLETFPDIWMYKNFTYSKSTRSDWQKRLFHAAYFLNPTVSNASKLNDRNGTWPLDPNGASATEPNYISYLASTFDNTINSGQPR